MIRNDSQSWGSVARALHWSMAALIAVQLCLGWIGHDMARSPAKVTLMTTHKSLGITLLALVFLRIAWRWTNSTPDLSGQGTRWELLAARASHAGLYLLLLALPISGWISASASAIPWKFWWLAPLPKLVATNPDLQKAAEETHEWLVTVLVVLLAVHVLAALRHHFLKGNDVLRRMWSG